jgi:SPP1 gp7 family putative phage head morphogenesis protein
VSWKVTADVDRYAEAVEWFGARVPLTVEQAAALDGEAARRAFTVAGVTELQIVQDIYDEVARGIAEGLPLEDIKAAIKGKVRGDWTKRDAAQLDTIVINASQQSYNAGRWRQMQDPAVKQLRPYGMFDGVNDSRQTPICQECDGTILPLDHPWWETHSPQLHHRCRSGIRSLRASDAERRGVTVEPPSTDAAVGFGLTPDNLPDLSPDPAKYDPALFSAYRSRQDNT